MDYNDYKALGESSWTVFNFLDALDALGLFTYSDNIEEYYLTDYYYDKCEAAVNRLSDMDLI